MPIAGFHGRRMVSALSLDAWPPFTSTSWTVYFAHARREYEGDGVDPHELDMMDIIM
jgi:hypothetical protein